MVVLVAGTGVARGIEGPVAADRTGVALSGGGPAARRASL